MLASQVYNKKVVFITTKNIDYIRNQQEIKLLNKYCNKTVIIGSENKYYFFRLIYVYLRLLFSSFHKYDIAFVGFSPQLVLPFFYWKFRNIFVIEDFFISLYDTFVFDRKKIKKDSYLSKLFKRLDMLTLKLADIIICDTKEHGLYFCDELGCEKSKLEVLYLEADESIYYPRHYCKKETDPFKVLYFGSILPLQGLDVIMSAISKILYEHNIRFEIIGPVDDLDRIDDNNIEYISWLPQSKLAEHIAMADICLAGHFAGDIAKARRTIPGKAYIYRAMGKPMILGDNPANRELFTEGNGIYFCNMGDSDSLSKTILEAIRDLSSNNQML
ncbi:MAG: glycosyltransferase [Anaerolineaceae bacterium]|nr:glycosyltransferase [Anaerolineaceae bacterium]